MNDNQILPDGEQKCVWMTSGIISYKLCNYNYNCEECMFDRVMRNEEAAMVRHPEVDAALAADLYLIERKTKTIDGSLFYHKSHCWVKVNASDEIVVGITNILLRLIYGIKTIILPKNGDLIRRDECFGHIIQDKHIVPLLSPATGEVVAINEILLNQPDVLLKENERLWIIKIKPENLEKDLRLMFFGSRAIDWYKEKEKYLSEAIHAFYSISGKLPELGQTMQDGGEFILNPSDMLAPDQYYSLLEKLCDGNISKKN